MMNAWRIAVGQLTVQYSKFTCAILIERSASQREVYSSRRDIVGGGNVGALFQPQTHQTEHALPPTFKMASRVASQIAAKPVVARNNANNKARWGPMRGSGGERFRGGGGACVA
eukprot:846961-Prorocentrum_minimum.AAC.4